MTHIFAVPPRDVAVAAQTILGRLEADPEFGAFRAASLEYVEGWQCTTGFLVIEQWNLANDAAPLFTEGLRALALKAAVYLLTDSDIAAEIPVAVPVDEMTHAMIAQTQLLLRIADRRGVAIIHQTDQEHTDYTADSFTAEAYEIVWGAPPARYWLEHAEVTRRREILAARYASIGLARSGREHDISFAEPVAA